MLSRTVSATSNIPLQLMACGKLVLDLAGEAIDGIADIQGNWLPSRWKISTATGGIVRPDLMAVLSKSSRSRLTPPHLLEHTTPPLGFLRPRSSSIKARLAQPPPSISTGRVFSDFLGWAIATLAQGRQHVSARAGRPPTSLIVSPRFESPGIPAIAEGQRLLPTTANIADPWHPLQRVPRSFHPTSRSKESGFDSTLGRAETQHHQQSASGAAPDLYPQPRDLGRQARLAREARFLALI